MGSSQEFEFKMNEAIAKLDEVDISQEERNVSSWMKALEEYKRMISAEKKRGSLKELMVETVG